MTYADRTTVPIYRTKNDIEKLVKKRGASGFGVMETATLAQVAFQMEGRNILFRFTIPEKEQRQRSIWRALLLTIKAKLESAESGIETFEDAFLANIVMPDGRTVSEHARPAIESNYSGQDMPLLLDMTGKGR